MIELNSDSEGSSDTGIQGIQPTSLPEKSGAAVAGCLHCPNTIVGRGRVPFGGARGSLITFDNSIGSFRRLGR